MNWTPFEERPRPPQLGELTLVIDRMRRIQIEHDDEAVVGEVFAWLLGQAMLTRGTLKPQARLAAPDAPKLEPEARARMDAVLLAAERAGSGSRFWRLIDEQYHQKTVLGVLAMMVDMRAALKRLDYLEAQNAKKPPAL
jgi:hypothetical protein